MALYSDSNTDHDLAITRYNRRTDKPYYVWVKVTSYQPTERTTRDDPGCGSDVECDAWTSMGYVVELDSGELSEACELYEQGATDAAIDECERAA